MSLVVGLLFVVRLFCLIVCVFVDGLLFVVLRLLLLSLFCESLFVYSCCLCVSCCWFVGCCGWLLFCRCVNLVCAICVCDLVLLKCWFLYVVVAL